MKLNYLQLSFASKFKWVLGLTSTEPFIGLKLLPQPPQERNVSLVDAGWQLQK